MKNELLCISWQGGGRGLEASSDDEENYGLLFYSCLIDGSLFFLSFLYNRNDANVNGYNLTLSALYRLYIMVPQSTLFNEQNYHLFTSQYWQILQLNWGLL